VRRGRPCWGLDSPLFADYSRQIIDGSEQAYLAAGYEPQAAAVSAMFSLTLERSQTLMSLADSLKGLQDEFIRTADFDAAEPTVIIGLTLGQRMQEQGPYLIDQLMGNAIERKFLQQLDPLTAAGPGGQTAAERLAALDANLLEIRTLSGGAAERLATMDEATRGQYLAKMKAEGELAALRWVAAQK
jgi:hypothetical protein